MEFSWSEILLELLAVAVLFFGVHWSLRHAKTLDQASMLPFADD
ncbi:cbb3-type cytochrome c oxidase subunit 3, partial [Pseudomonas aeruginosa]